MSDKKVFLHKLLLLKLNSISRLNKCVADDNSDHAHGSHYDENNNKVKVKTYTIEEVESLTLEQLKVQLLK